MKKRGPMFTVYHRSINSFLTVSMILFLPSLWSPPSPFSHSPNLIYQWQHVELLEANGTPSGHRSLSSSASRSSISAPARCASSFWLTECRSSHPFCNEFRDQHDVWGVVDLLVFCRAADLLVSTPISDSPHVCAIMGWVQSCLRSRLTFFVTRPLRRVQSCRDVGVFTLVGL